MSITVSLDPTATGTDNAHTLGAGANKVVAVTRPDDDATTYIYNTASAARQGYNHSALPTSTDQLVSNLMRYRWRMILNEETDPITEQMTFGGLLSGTYNEPGLASFNSVNGDSGWNAGSHSQPRPGGGSFSITDVNNTELVIRAPMVSGLSTCYTTTIYWDWTITLAGGSGWIRILRRPAYGLLAMSLHGLMRSDIPKLEAHIARHERIRINDDDEREDLWRQLTGYRHPKHFA